MKKTLLLKMTIRLKLKIEMPYYSLNDKEIGDYLKELKKTKEKIEKYDYTFQEAGLSNREQVKEVLSEINEQITLCEHYFITKKRKDLFKWIFLEKQKNSNGYGDDRDVYSFSNGMVKAIIEIFKREKSTEIEYRILSDSKLYIYFDSKPTNKNLRSEESIKNYIDEVKKYLEEAIKRTDYNRNEKRFYDFILGEKNE